LSGQLGRIVIGIKTSSIQGERIISVSSPAIHVGTIVSGKTSPWIKYISDGSRYCCIYVASELVSSRKRCCQISTNHFDEETSTGTDNASPDSLITSRESRIGVSSDN